MISLSKPVQADASNLARAGNHPAIASTMISLPSPFTTKDAEAWIADLAERSDLDGYLIIDRAQNALIGAAELRDIDQMHRQAEVSFWLTPACWGRGFASAALLKLVRIAFDHHGLNRVYAFHMARNPASGRVMAKCGFHLEGRLRQRVWKDRRSEDAILWSRLLNDPPSSGEAKARDHEQIGS